MGIATRSSIILRGAVLWLLSAGGACTLACSAQGAGGLEDDTNWLAIDAGTGSPPSGSNLSGDRASGGEAFLDGFVDSADARAKYGGAGEPRGDHDCGALQYARIEFAGFSLGKKADFNGLTLGACGASTVIDFVQVHKVADDGVEVFGGAPGLKHLVVTQAGDEGFDWDLGFTGRVQFLVVQQGTETGNYGIEGDNNSDDKDALPRSKPVLWNVSLVGTSRAAGGDPKSGAVHFRTGSAGELHNLIAQNSPDVAVDVDGKHSVAACKAAELVVRTSVLWNLKGSATSLLGDAPDKDNDKGFDEAAHLMESANGNRYVDPMLEDPLNLLRPGFRPRASSPAFIGGAAPPSGGFFDPTATFIGAMGDTDWTEGWTSYPET